MKMVCCFSYQKSDTHLVLWKSVSSFTEGASVDCTRYRTAVIRGAFRVTVPAIRPPDYPALSRSPWSPWVCFWDCGSVSVWKMSCVCINVSCRLSDVHCFSIWCTSLSRVISRSIPVAAVDIHSFLWLSKSPLYIFTTSFLSTHPWIGCLHILTIVNTAAVKVRVHVSLQVMVFSGYMPMSGVVWSFGSFFFSYLRNLSIILIFEHCN